MALRGLRRLGETYFPEFAAANATRGLPDLIASLSAAERRALRALLFGAAVCPRPLLRLLIRCEDEARDGWLIRFFAPVHIQIKGLTALLYFDAVTRKGKDPHV
ncbi:MAG: hypothetical protein AAGA32_10345 [Pseudomonadota bacterium]